MFVLKPARSMLALASTVVCGALPRRNEKLCVGGRDRAGLDVSAANGEGDDTAGISMPENSSVFPERPDIQYRICVDGHNWSRFRSTLFHARRRSSKSVGDDFIRCTEQFADAQG
jgi:hypothetical protein